jgi:hypothetical protein
VLSLKTRRGGRNGSHVDGGRDHIILILINKGGGVAFPSAIFRGIVSSQEHQRFPIIQTGRPPNMLLATTP